MAPSLTSGLGLEVGGFALQRRRQVIKTERQLPLEGGVLLAEGWEAPEGALPHQLLDGRVPAGDGVRPARFRPFHGGRRTLWGGGSARREGWSCRGLVWWRERATHAEQLLFKEKLPLRARNGLTVPLPFFLSGSFSSLSLLLLPPCWLQVELPRKEPSRTNEVRLASKEAVTPHSFSLRCFLSRQAAKAQPTAWLSLSPWWRNAGKVTHRGRGVQTWAKAVAPRWDSNGGKPSLSLFAGIISCLSSLFYRQSGLLCERRFRQR